MNLPLHRITLIYREFYSDKEGDFVGNKNYYPLLDIAKFAAALLVILVHCGRLFENDQLHFFVKNILCRLAVPLFLVSSGYFCRQRLLADEGYFKRFFRRQSKDYLLWSALYLPYGLYFVSTLHLPVALYPLALIAAIACFGVCYHLWYYPGLFLGLWLVIKSKKKLCYPICLLVGAILFGFGACETYSSYLGTGALHQTYTIFHHLFLTSRNGLFYSFIFLLLGFLLTDYQHHPFLSKRLPLKITLSLVMLTIEGSIVFQNQGDDKNFLFALLPTSLFLVALLLNSKKLEHRSFRVLNQLSKYLFLLHPLFLEAVKGVAKAQLHTDFQGLPLFFITSLLTLLSSGVILKIKKIKVSKARAQLA